MSATLAAPLGFDSHPLAPLRSHLEDPDVSEIMVLHDGSVWTETHDGIERAGGLADHEVTLCLELLARRAGRRLDLLSPILDCVLEDGSRVCAAIPPIAHGGPVITVRRFRRSILPLAAFGDPRRVSVVESLVRARRNVVVSGSTSAGKTSLLSAVSRHFAPDERVVCAEDTAELRFVHPHVVRLQCRAAGIDGRGEVTLQHLVRASMRMRPDRLVVGEVRGAEVVDMLLALGSGHRGCWTTIHAGSATDSIDRIAALVLRDSPQWTESTISTLVRSAVDAVVHVERDGSGRRRISEVIVRGDDGVMHDVPVERG